MFNPALASENIKQEFIDYITTTHSFADASLRKQFSDNLKKEVAQGPFLEIRDVFTHGESIDDLIRDGVLSPLFADLEAGKPASKPYKICLPLSRKLYQHQVDAIRKITAGENVVISTGTGSGKTNCFLIPVINKLLREKEAGTLGKGVRALFIYPMNALANDQMKNIRNILMYYPDITFGVYNGGTEYDEEKATSVYEAMFANEAVPELRRRLPNEILSRDEMKETPPNILFTNYAMLEHLLFRPKDDVLFSDADFSFVVLDEAHIYTGATGIETSILLRRLQARIASKNGTQFILTSATLGSDNSSDDDIVTFANNLCGVPFSKNNIIRSTRDVYIDPPTVTIYPNDLYNELADEQNDVSDVFNKYGLHFNGNSESEQLYDFLQTTNLYSKLRKNVSEISSISEIQKILGLDLGTTISFISICTRAQKNGKSLIDARYHFFIRCLEGAFMSVLPSKTLSLTRQKSIFTGDKKYEVFEIAICDECGKIAFVGKVKNKHLVQTSKLGEMVDYYYPAEDQNEDFIGDDEQSEVNTAKQETFFLCPICGAIVAADEIHNLPCDCGRQNYIKVIKARHLQAGARCGNCHTGTYRRFYLGNDAATGVLATALYEELPGVVYEMSGSSAVNTDNPFAIAASKGRKNQKRIERQFLAFSDSRQEAAKFACYLSKSYAEFLRRRGICQIVNEIIQKESSARYTISDYVDKLTNYYTGKKSFASSNVDASNLTMRSRKNAWVAMLNELARSNSSTSLVSLGIIQFSYAGNTPALVDYLANQYKVSPKNMKSLLDLLAFEIVKAGAVITDGESDIDDNDREYIFYTPSQRFVTYLQSPDRKKSTVTDWAPRNKAGKANEYFTTNKMYYVCETLGITESDAAKFLKDYFEYITDPNLGNAFCMQDINKDQTYVMPAKYFNVLVSGDPDAKWYKCQKCGRVSPFVFNGKCSSTKCDGNVVETKPEDLRKDNHFANLYYSNRMSPLFIKEHTAQLSKKESAEYQEQFVKKEINALSCSTTFEMGVDVGDLETVFLRDVPPMPSNYAQRAGRAGRSVNAAAYALTYAKLSSHDLSYFKEPQKMIGGIIQPPLFKVDNEKIVRRHIYAIALSMFFSEHEELYNHNDAEEFINKKGYMQFIDWISTKPDRLKDMIKRSIPDIDHLHQRIGIDNFRWIDDFSGTDGVFTQLITEYENNVQEFEKQISKLKKVDLTAASSCERKMQNYMSNELMDFLARGNILPRYGFPVDTVELQQNVTAKNDLSKLRLSRDLQLAIAEYAPSSEVIADGKLYTSRYIKKTKIGTNKQDWHTAYIGICDNPVCQTVNYSVVPVTSSGIKCSSCGKILKPFVFHESIEPRSGFVTERTVKDVPMTQQERNYRSEDFYVGNVSAKTIEKYFYTFNGIQIKVESTTNDSLMVKSTKNFYVCPKCGFAYAEDEHFGDKDAEKDMAMGALKITTSKAHESLYSQTKCDCKDLHRRTLHHVFNTDVAKITFGCDTHDYETMISVMYAILYAISSELNIERKDIKACLSLRFISGHLKYSIIIYDAVPGGAGHSRRLVTSDGQMLYRILLSALKRVSSCTCNPSCYNCLRSYENQKIHDELDRNLATNFLKQFVGAVCRIDEKDATEFCELNNGNAVSAGY